MGEYMTALSEARLPEASLSLLPSPTHVSDDGAASGEGLLGERPGSHYTVILATGAEDGGKRATLALSMACTALSLGLRTLVFLVGDGSHWAYEGHSDGIVATGFPSLDDLLQSYVELGGKVAVCSTCNHCLCHVPDKAGVALVLRAEVEVQGMATVMDHLLLGRVVTF
jgi:predicted peroxiredoxin